MRGARGQADPRRALAVAFAINASMFVVESTAGWSTQSTGLVADSFDMFGDALTLGLSLFVIGRGAASIAGVAFLKAAFMAVFGLLVLVQVAHKLVNPAVPDAATMSIVGALALLANAICATLLARHRSSGLNMRSVWICSRNDVCASVVVLAAGFGVSVSRSQWPDLVAGAAIAALYLYSAGQVFRQTAISRRVLA